TLAAQCASRAGGDDASASCCQHRSISFGTDAVARARERQCVSERGAVAARRVACARAATFVAHGQTGGWRGVFWRKKIQLKLLLPQRALTCSSVPEFLRAPWSAARAAQPRAEILEPKRRRRLCALFSPRHGATRATVCAHHTLCRGTSRASERTHGRCQRAL